LLQKAFMANKLRGGRRIFKAQPYNKRRGLAERQDYVSHKQVPGPGNRVSAGGGKKGTSGRGKEQKSFKPERKGEGPAWRGVTGERVVYMHGAAPATVRGEGGGTRTTKGGDRRRKKKKREKRESSQISLTTETFRATRI